MAHNIKCCLLTLGLLDGWDLYHYDNKFAICKLNVKCNNDYSVQNHCMGIAQMRQESEKSLLLPLSIFCCRLTSHLFSLSYPVFCLFSHLCSVCAATHHFADS